MKLHNRCKAKCLDPSFGQLSTELVMDKLQMPPGRLLLSACATQFQ